MGALHARKLMWARPEADNFQIIHRDHCSCNRTELCDHIRTFFGGSNGILRNIGFDISQLQVTNT